MAKHIKSLRSGWMPTLVLTGFVVIMGAPWDCFAATGLVDPTQPPSELGVAGSNDVQITGEPVLQSVMLSASRKIAIISGQSVRVGEKFRDATLIKVTDREAVLRDSEGVLHTLKMYSAVEKKVISQPQENALGQRKAKRIMNKTVSDRP